VLEGRDGLKKPTSEAIPVYELTRLGSAAMVCAAHRESCNGMNGRACPQKRADAAPAFQSFFELKTVAPENVVLQIKKVWLGPGACLSPVSLAEPYALIAGHKAAFDKAEEQRSSLDRALQAPIAKATGGRGGFFFPPAARVTLKGRDPVERAKSCRSENVKKLVSLARIDGLSAADLGR